MTLREKTLHGVKWNLLSTILTTVLGVISLWILSHLLTTQDYGVISAALIISSFFTIVLDFGISNSIVRSKKIEEIELSSLYVINIAMGITTCVSILIFSEQIANLFKADGMLTIQIRVMSFGFIILAFGLQPRALLVREMNFSAISKITMATTVTNFIVVIILAWIYRSPWSIALAFLISSFVSAILSNYITRSLRIYKFQFKFSSVKKHFRYGAQLVMDSVINQVNINTYPVLMSRLISISAIGGYNIAYSISIALFERLNPVLSHALFPAFSKIADDESKLQKTFLQVTMYAAMVNFPMLLGMMVIAHPLVNVFFDEKWQFISPIIEVLCVVGAIRSLDTPVISVLLAKAEMYRNVWLGIAKLIIGIPFAWLLGYRLGLIGIVFSFLVIQVMNTICGYFFLIKKSTKINGAHYLKSILIPLLHVVPMVTFGFIIRHYINQFSDFVNLIFVILSCALVYIATIYVSPLKSIREFRMIIMNNFVKRL